MCRSVLCAVWAILPPDRGSMRAPSLLRALVVRLTIVVVLALAGSYLLLYFEFREGLMGLEGQSIAIQVQDLRASIVSGAARGLSPSVGRPRKASSEDMVAPVMVKQGSRPVADAQARQIGQRLFLGACAQCHGSDAGGSRGFPSLRDRDGDAGGVQPARPGGRCRSPPSARRAGPGWPLGRTGAPRTRL